MYDQKGAIKIFTDVKFLCYYSKVDHKMPIRTSFEYINYLIQAKTGCMSRVHLREVESFPEICGQNF